MKIVIVAGGGGHFNPALAVMNKLPKGTDILFIGRKYAFEKDKTLSFEYLTMQKLQVPLTTITTGRLQRSLSFSTILSLGRLPLGFVQSLHILRKFQPDVVFSTGGYVGVPVTLAAWLLKIPVVLHEQTLRVGLANKIAAPFAAKICLSWEASRKYFPKEKSVLTGNPVKREVGKRYEKLTLFSESLPMLFITGGSLGSHAVNVLIEGTLSKLLEKYTVYHQTGDAKEYGDFNRLEKRKEDLPETLKKRYHVTKFIPPDEIARVFANATLVVGRSGINTIAELIIAKKPALLIPLPYGQRGEQQENAEFFASLGLGKVLKQEHLTAETVYTEIDEMVDHLDSYTLKKDSSELIHIDAEEKIIATIFSVAQTTSLASEENETTK